MSNYTTELRFICENYAGRKENGDYGNVADVIAASRTKLFSFDYPIFDNAYKSTLETKIIRHFYTREIAHESVGLFKLRLEAKMNEIMPYYNQLYKSELIEFNPMYDTDLTRDHTKNNSGDSQVDDDYTGTRDRNLNEWNKYHDTPQSGINFAELSDGQYLTDVRNITDTEHIADDNNRDIDREYKDLEEYIEHVKGKSPGVSFSKFLNEFRETFLNIDMMIIEELNPLFFNLW